MIKLVLSDKSTTVVIVNPENDQQKIDFSVSSIVSRRNKEELAPEHQYDVLNAFLNYKGMEFKIELYRRYAEADETIMANIIKKELTPLPFSIAHQILEMFDLKEMKAYLKDIYKLTAPASLEDTFEAHHAQVLGYTKEQTYIKDEYMDLAALITVIKSVLPTVGYFAEIKESDLNNALKEQILYEFIRTYTPVGSSVAIIKLRELIKKLMGSPTNSDEADSIRVIEKGVPKEHMHEHLLANVVVQRLFVANVLMDKEDKHIVNKIFGYVNMRLRNKGDVASTIRDKDGLTSIDGDGMDKESMIESYKVISKLPIATDVEFNFFLENIHDILPHLPITFDPNDKDKTKVYFNKDILIDAEGASKKMYGITLDKIHFIILGIIFKKVIYPETLDYVKIEVLTNLLAIGSTYLFSLGLNGLGLLLLSYRDMSSSDKFYINLSANRSRVPKELKDELAIYFPFEREINATTRINVVDDIINDLGNEINSKKWITFMPRKYLDELNVSNGDFISPDIKIHLTSFLIEHEKLLLQNKKGY